MENRLLRKPEERELYEQVEARTDYQYKIHDLSASRMAYRDYVSKARRNFLTSLVVGTICIARTRKYRVLSFFTGSLVSFSALNYTNESNFLAVTNKASADNTDRLNLMMDLK